MQEKAFGIEFEDIKKCTSLKPTSHIYIEKFKKNEREGKGSYDGIRSG